MNNEFTFETEDNPVFPGARMPLNKIFDVEPNLTKGEESLRYQPPKPSVTKLETPPAPQALPWSTRLAKVVVGFKNGEPLGRVGVAILSNVENAYRIIVYKTKSSLLATLTIVEDGDTPHMIRQNCYWQFYDDIGLYWSLLFERSSDEAEFISKLKECHLPIQLDLEVKAENLRTVETTKKPEPLWQLNKKFEKFQLTNKEEDYETSTLSDEQKKPKADSTANAKLMAHLLKIGGQKLPMLSKQSETEDNESNESSETIDRSTSLTVIGQPVYDTNSEIHNKYILPLGQTTAIDKTSSTSVYNPVEAQIMQMMLVENRTQNTELRINMDKLESKIEKVIDKIDLIHTNSDQDDELFKLEEKILALKKENRRLKREGKNNIGKTENSHENVYSIYGSELTGLGIDINPSRPPEIEAIVGELIDKITNLQNQLQDKEMQLKNVTLALRDQKERNQHEKEMQTELKDELDKAKNKIKILESSLERKKEDEIQLNARLDELKSQHATHLNKAKVEMIETLKDIMNTLYHNLAQGIVRMEKLLPDKVLALIGKTIRQDTLSAVKKMTK